MIFLDEITNIPQRIDIKIPISIDIDDKLIIYDCGGADTESNIIIDGGFANSIQKMFINCGGAEDEYLSIGNIEVLLRHITTNEVIISKGGIKSQNSLYFTFSFQFDKIPPVGQYDIIVKNGNTIIYKGILQVGKIKNNNKKYDLEYNGKQY